MAQKPPYFPFYVKDFCADSKVEAMTTEEVGAYILLLCKAWHEDVAGSLPNDDETLARWSRMTTEKWSKCKDRILMAFSLGSDNRFHQKRMQMEYAKLAKIIKAKSVGGKRGAKAKWDKRNGQENSDGIPIGSANGSAIETPNGTAYGNPMAPGSDSYSLEDSNQSETVSKEGDRGVGKGGMANSLPVPYAGPGYYPELSGPSKAIVKQYQDAVRPAHDHRGGENAVIELLATRAASQDHLAAAVRNYAAHAQKSIPDRRMRLSARNFFGGDAPAWECWVNGSAIPPDKQEMTEEEYKRMMLEEHEKQQKRLKALLK